LQEQKPAQNRLEAVYLFKGERISPLKGTKKPQLRGFGGVAEVY